MFSLAGKKILLTGASGGIGSKIAEVMMASGAVITLSGSNQEKLQKFSESFDYMHKHTICADLADASACKSLVSQANDMMGGIDIVICNAGYTSDMPFLRISDQNFQKVLDINLTASFIINREAAKLMMKQSNNNGRLINISSVVASTGNAGQINYSAAKAGLEGMTRSFALEVASRGITVNAIAPGFISSPMTDILSDVQKDKILTRIPRGHMGQAADIANTVVFLSSEEASYITGQTIHVNGGMYMN